MLGLTGYSSSSEDEGSVPPLLKKQKVEQSSSATSTSAKPQKAVEEQTIPIRPPQPEPPQDQDTTERPVAGPSRPTQATLQSEDGLEGPSRAETPSTESRTLLRDLTLPPVPNLDIPPSPPGSPDAAVSQRFAHFLRIKRTGAHFNEKLAQSSSLKNPSLFEKLTQHAHLDEQAQYATTLSQELWDPLGLPPWGHRLELRKRYEERKRLVESIAAHAQKKPIEFVPESKRPGAPGGGGGGAAAAAAASRSQSHNHHHKMSAAVATDPFPYRLTISLPLPTYRLANAAKRTVEVDTELSSSVSRKISLAGITHEGEKADSMPNESSNESSSDATKQDGPTLMITEYKAATNRMLRVAVNGFMESIGVALGAMAELDVDVMEHEAGARR